MKLGSEVLLKSFGNGVAVLRFQEEQTKEGVTPFVESLGMPVEEFVVGEPATDVFLMLGEGHPVSILELRNASDEDMMGLAEAVDSDGSERFGNRVAGLALARKSLAENAD